MSLETTNIKLAGLQAHPSQPPTRTLDTTELQASMGKVGQLQSITIASDGTTVLSGWRRVTAAKALGWTIIAGRVTIIAADSPEAIDIVVASNEQTPLTAMQLVEVLRGYEEHGIKFREACRRCGIKSNKARTLARLSSAPPEVQQAVERYDRGHKDEGLSFSAFAQMQDLGGQQQIEILLAGKKTKTAVRAETKKLRAGTVDKLVEDPASARAMVEAAHDLAVRAIALAGWLETASPVSAGDVRTAYSAALPALHRLIEPGKEAT